MGISKTTRTPSSVTSTRTPRTPRPRTLRAPMHPACRATGHNYTPVNNAVSRFNTPEGVIVEHAFICTKCGDARRVQVAFWPVVNATRETRAEAER
jgi:hypothetical protein